MSNRTLLDNTDYVGDEIDSAGCPRDAGAIQRSRSFAVLGKTAQVSTITVDTGAADTVYEIELGETSSNLIEVTATSASGIADDAAGHLSVATTMSAAINAKVGVANLVYAAPSLATIVITSRRKGTSGTFSSNTDDDANLSAPVATTAAANETGLYPGQGAEVLSFASALSLSEEGCAPIGYGTYTAAVYGCDVDAQGAPEASDEITVVIRMDINGDGKREIIGQAVALFDTDQDTTLDALVVDLNAALPANSVIVSNTPATATDLIFTSEMAGLDFEVEVMMFDASASESTPYAVTTTTANAIPELAGFVLRGNTQVQDDDGLVLYKTGDTLSACQGGEMKLPLDPSETIVKGDPVFMRVHAATSPERKGDCRMDSDSGDALPLSAWGYVGEWTGVHGVGFDGQRTALALIKRL
ncbi:MAG: hypothetical protein GY778_16025 [bacterium]|nr:hypothetical protein [bacterium]